MALALEQKLVLLSQSLRPDLGNGAKSFRIGVKGSEEQRVVKEGEALFLNVIEHPSGGIETVEFSDSLHGKKMIPHLLNGSSVLLKLEGDAGEILLQASPQNGDSSRRGMDIFDQYQAKLWGSDLFFREYGGAEYRVLGQKQKIELSDGSKSYFLFVAPKDFLTFRDNRWHVLASVEEADPAAPLACVQAAGHNFLEIEGWDVDGFPLFQTKLNLEKQSPLNFSPDQSITQAKLRSANQVSCKIGKKRMVLKPGDWVIKTQTGWRKLVLINEIESYLNNELQGELFVVDAIEAGGQLKGRQFDPKRVQMKPFTIQAVSSKAKSTKKRTVLEK